MKRSIAAFCISGALVASPALGQELSTYRGAHMGDPVQGVILATGASPSRLKLIHERPALMQELEWRPSSLGGAAPMPDPVQRVVFSFYHDQLYRVFVTYDRARIEGLTDDDLLDSLKVAYGPPITTDAAKVLRPSEAPDVGTQYRVVARWEDAEHSIVLVRGAYLVPLSLVVLAKHVAEDARHAEAEAARLHISEGPAREALRARQEAEVQRLALEKARPANKAAFKP